MSKYEEIIEAMSLFSLSEKETIKEIKRKINTRIKKWHPDTCNEKKEESNEKSISLIKAKKVIMQYLENYKISFEKDEIEKYLSPQELWMSQFRHDHIWGDGKTK